MPEEKDEEEKEEELQVTSSLCHRQKHEFQSAQDPDAWIMNPEMYYLCDIMRHLELMNLKINKY